MVEQKDHLRLAEVIHILRDRPVSISENFALHAGIHDLELGTAVKQVIFLFQKIIYTVKGQSPEANILISGLLPRNVEDGVPRQTVKVTNDKLCELCANNVVAFVPSFKAFLCRGRPRPDRFQEGSNELSASGSLQLTQSLRHALSPNNRSTFLEFARKRRDDQPLYVDAKRSRLN